MISSDDESHRVQKAVSNFRLLAEIPTIKSAEFIRESDDEYLIRTNTTARSFSSNSRTTSRPHFTLNLYTNNLKTRWISAESNIDTNIDPIKAIFSSHPLHSKSSKVARTVILRQCKNDKGQDQRFVELWQMERILKSVNVTEAHGPFYTDDIYGSFSLFEDRVLYTAEQKEAKKETEISKRSDQSHSDGLQSYEYQPPLGSTYIGKVYPRVFQLNFNITADHANSKSFPQLYCIDPDPIIQHDSLQDPILAQAIFSPTGAQILLTAYPALIDGRRLGLGACPNRPSIVYCIDANGDDKQQQQQSDQETESIETSPGCAIKEASFLRPQKWRKLSRQGFSGRAPSIASAGKCVWLECRSGGPHRGSDVIYSVDPSDLDGKHEIRCEIDQINLPSSQKAFPGLFVDTTLTKSCSLSRFDAIAITTIWGSRQTIVLHRMGHSNTPVEVTSPSVSVANHISERDQMWNYNLLCTNGDDLLVAVRSSPICAQQILLGRVSEKDGQVEVNWNLVKSMDEQWQDEKPIRELKQSTLATILDIESPTVKGTENKQSIEAILLSPTSSGKPSPFMLELHGGPHGSSLTAFSPALAAICLSGYCILQPNYHGSLGRGQNFVDSLIGNCGQLDVKDCQAAAEYLVKNANRIQKGLELDPDRVYVDGGSHGGFLSLHLVGQYPSFYRASIARNPVTAVQLMEGTNDIPDWFYAEFGHAFDYSNPPHCPTPEQFKNLSSASPFAYLDQIQVPVLLLVGLSDQRVAPSQSKAVYHALRSRIRKEEVRSTSTKGNLDVRMLTFKDEEHGLTGIEAELISFEARFRWLA